MTRHALAILAWATFDVLFVAACWRYGVVADRAIGTRQKLAHLWRRGLGAGQPETPVISLAEFKDRAGRRRRRA